MTFHAAEHAAHAARAAELAQRADQLEREVEAERSAARRDRVHVKRSMLPRGITKNSCACACEDASYHAE